MGSGRRRKHNPGIPKYIDQTKLPEGIYWSNRGEGRWYVFVDDPDGPRNTKVVAGRTARLSDLHAIMEERAGKIAVGTISYVGKLFAESTEFAEKSKNTQDDYNYCLDVASKYKTDRGKGPTFDTLHIDRLTLPAIQKVIETIVCFRQGCMNS